jgi:hypothetical protein
VDGTLSVWNYRFVRIWLAPSLDRDLVPGILRICESYIFYGEDRASDREYSDEGGDPREPGFYVAALIFVFLTFGFHDFIVLFLHDLSVYIMVGNSRVIGFQGRRVSDHRISGSQNVQVAGPQVGLSQITKAELHAAEIPRCQSHAHSPHRRSPAYGNPCHKILDMEGHGTKFQLSKSGSPLLINSSKCNP